VSLCSTRVSVRHPYETCKTRFGNSGPKINFFLCFNTP